VTVAANTGVPVSIEESRKILFPQGLFGFEGIHDYYLVDRGQQPYYWLQAAEPDEAAFIVINPFLFRPDYEMDLDDGELASLQLDKAEDALVFAILTVPVEGPMTANLQGPVVISRGSLLGRQLILSDPRWHTKHNVMDELAAAKAAKKASC
jgi:flagellar assembly factor FliW